MEINAAPQDAATQTGETNMRTEAQRYKDTAAEAQALAARLAKWLEKQASATEATAKDFTRMNSILEELTLIDEDADELAADRGFAGRN